MKVAIKRRTADFVTASLAAARDSPHGIARREDVLPVEPAEAEALILRLLGEAGAGRTVGPPDVARLLIPGPDWHHAMMAVRRAAVSLALAGRIVIYRKGKPVDPNDFKGVYRLGLPRQD